MWHDLIEKDDIVSPRNAVGPMQKSKFYDQGLKHIVDKQMRVNRLKDEVYQKEMEECTFSPRLATYRFKSPRGMPNTF